MKKTDLRKVLAAVTVVSVAAGLVLAAGCKSSCSGGSCSGGKPASTDTQPKSSCTGTAK
ncbi:MAG: FeoB-associated Cys-rich membrane protein [Candidatus Brocadiia bacterium]